MKVLKRNKNNGFIVFIKFAVHIMKSVCPHWFVSIETVYMLTCKWSCNVATEIYQKQRRHGVWTQIQEQWDKEDDSNYERETEKADISVEQWTDVALVALTWSFLVKQNCFKLRDQIVTLQWSDVSGVLLMLGYMTLTICDHQLFPTPTSQLLLWSFF